MFIVELEKGVYLAPWYGDPGRTLVRERAREYPTRNLAGKGIDFARKFREFDEARVIPFNNTQHTHEAILCDSCSNILDCEVNFKYGVRAVKCNEYMQS